MNNIKYFILLFLITGCYRPATIKDDESFTYIKPSKFKVAWSKEGMYVPNWIEDPTINGKYEAAVGSSYMNGSFSEYKEKAYINAITEINRSRKVHLKNIYRNYESTGVSYEDNTSKLDTYGEIYNAKIASTWIQTNTKEYYIWVIVYK
jgi:hypothetical protein